MILWQGSQQVEASVMQLLLYPILALVAAAWCYQLLALVSLGKFFARRLARPAVPSGPGVTVFKPLQGLEPDSRECLTSFLTQDYRPYQVLFGIKDPQSELLPLLRELQQVFPRVETAIVLCPEHLGLNPKISSLRQMEPQARYDLLALTDADLRVGPDFLGRAVAALQDQGLGLVSFPYRAGRVQTAGAGLEALTIAADFIPSVATARQVEEIRFALGGAMVLTREALQQSGGLAPLADFLADDYQLGWRVAAAGLKVDILPYVVETSNPVMGLSAFLTHQLRWARTYRVCRPKGYLAYGITHAWVYSVLACLLSGSAPWSLGLALATLTLRLTLVLVSERCCLQGALPWWSFVLLPLKDFLTFGIWLLSFMGDRVVWGGRRYRLTPEGKLTPE
jgi:ceramide glucosyltransferase